LFFIGPIPIELTRLGGLKEFLIFQEPLLTGFLKIIFQIK